MPPANPEQGLIESLKRIFLGRREQPPLPVPAQLSTAERAERKRQAQAKPLEILEELKRITPSHPARQLLPKIDFSSEALTQYPQLTNTLLSIVTGNPSDYHDPRWLLGKLRELHEVTAALSANPQLLQDQQWLQETEYAFEKTIKSAMQYIAGEEVVGQVRQDARDTRLVEMEREIRQAKGEAVPQDERLRAEVKQIKPPATLEEAIDRVIGIPGLSEAEQRALTEKKEEIINQGRLDKTTGDRVEPGGNLVDLAGELEKLIDKNIGEIREEMRGKELKQDTIERHNARHMLLREAYEKIGRVYIDKYQGNSRFQDEIRKRGGYEMMLKAMENDPSLRDYWFYHIIENILYNPRIDHSRDLYNLWVAGDMDLFMEMARKIRGFKGETMGLQIASRYALLKNTIFQSNDMDFYAAHPQQDMKEFIGSTAMFLNTYVDAAHQDPMVSLAKRAYEQALLTIRESHGRYIPRKYLAYDAATQTLPLDEKAKKILKTAIASGQLCQVKIDPVTGLYDRSPSGRLQIDRSKIITKEDLYGGEPEISEKWKRELGELKIAAALKQAKGLALVDMRLLEIIGRSKGTGSDHFYFGGNKGFNSVPYEGIVRHIEPIIHYFTRWYIGREDYDAFFNMMITDRPDWDADKMKRLIELSQDGDRDTLVKEFGPEIDTRLNAMENPFGFSGMWGTFTKWRMNDSTVGWDDWDRERFATANKLCLVGDSFFREKSRWQADEKTTAYRKVKQYFSEVINPEYETYRKDYRDRLSSSDDVRLRQIALDDALFEAHWRGVGLGQTAQGETKSYQKRLDEYWKNEYIVKTHEGSKPIEKADELIKKLERAYKARIWVQAVMRAPLVAAREIDAPSWLKADYPQKGKKLRDRIIYKILGIDLQEMVSSGGPPVLDEQRLGQIMDLEGAVFAVSQAAIRENRDLKEEDFDRFGENAKDKLLASQAKQYWVEVKKAMLGNRTAEEWYQNIGIKDADAGIFGVDDVLDPRANGARFHRIDWDKIRGVSLDKKEKGKENKLCIQGLGPTAINNKLLDKDYRYLFSTEDMGWEYLNMGELGERNQMRRAGDLASHVQFNSGFEELLNVVITPRFTADAFVEHLKKMWIAMAGDDANVSIDACGRIIYTLGQMYRKSDWAWKIPGAGQAVALFKDASIMQKLHGRMFADAIGPNQLREFVDKAAAAKLIPRHAVNPFTGRRETWSEWNTDVMYKRLGATRTNTLYELITMGILISLALTIYRAFTAKSEEEEAGAHK